MVRRNVAKHVGRDGRGRLVKDVGQGLGLDPLGDLHSLFGGQVLQDTGRPLGSHGLRRSYR